MRARRQMMVRRQMMKRSTLTDGEFFADAEDARDVAENEPPAIACHPPQGFILPAVPFSIVN